MNNNQFFKPTPLYKEYMLLDLIEKDPCVTQRQMSQTLDVALSMVNSYIEEYEKQGYLERKYHSLKVVEYHITKKGIERLKVLNIGYLNSSQILYNSAKENIEQFMIHIENKNFKNIILYGAGEVAQIFLNSIESRPKNQIEVVAIIDDDEAKQGKTLNNKLIISRNKIKEYSHDGILISSYMNKEIMYKNLQEQQYNLNRVFNFFDIEERDR